MSYEDKQEHTTAEAASEAFRNRCLNEQRKRIRSMRDEITSLRAALRLKIESEKSDLFTVAYRDGDNWRLTKYPWCKSEIEADKIIRWLQSSFQHSGLELRIVQIRFLERRHD